MMNSVASNIWQKANFVAALFFLIGQFTSTRINLGGSIAIAEVVMTMVAPFVLLKEWTNMRWCGALRITVFVNI